MYEFLLNTHNITRWIILPLGIFVIGSGLLFLQSQKPFSKLESATGGILVGLAHLQLIIGLLLYFVYSPQVSAALSDFGSAMKDSHLRLKILEHPLTGILAVAFIQAGRTLSKKTRDVKSKRKKIVLFTSIAFVLILSRIPNWF